MLHKQQQQSPKKAIKLGLSLLLVGQPMAIPGWHPAPWCSHSWATKVGMLGAQANRVAGVSPGAHMSRDCGRSTATTDSQTLRKENPELAQLPKHPNTMEGDTLKPACAGSHRHPGRTLRSKPSHSNCFSR